MEERVNYPLTFPFARIRVDGYKANTTQPQPAQKGIKMENEVTSPEPIAAAPKPERIKQNGITRPNDGTATGNIWLAADQLSAHLARPVLATELTAHLGEGYNSSTVSTQYNVWCTFNGVSAAERKAMRDAIKNVGKAEADAEKAAAKEAKAAGKAEARAVAAAEKAAAKAAAAAEKAALKEAAAAEKAKAGEEATAAKAAAKAEAAAAAPDPEA